ncbi:hypothetical protein PDJAM_G00225080 [Pangasius djambal]|uniref:Uncharacterized protein n=1 Tax=Pangasius djambal TaxID=1691987 RepID=A0ACC5YCU0_9TELE|nr:hypothetical protein [Pangasius djambal]
MGAQGSLLRMRSEGFPAWNRSHRRTTVAQIAENINAGYDRKVSENTVLCSLLRMELHNRRLVRVPMLTPVHQRKRLQWACEHQNWTMKQWKKVAWSDEPRFPLHHVDGRVRVHRLPGEKTAPGCTMGRRQAGGGSVMPWTMFCWENLGPGIHVDVTLTHSTYLNIVADQVHPFMATVFPNGTPRARADHKPGSACGSAPELCLLPDFLYMADLDKSNGDLSEISCAVNAQATGASRRKCRVLL